MQNRLSADNVEAETLGNHTSGIHIVGNALDNMLDLVGILPGFALLAPLGKAVLATIIAGFGNVPIDAHRDGRFCMSRHNVISFFKVEV
jgi:hypothetical protein